MAVINPATGKIRGKIAGMVYAVTRGVNTVREYNPAPFNPSTVAQTESRAKLKLLSQVSAIVAPVLAVPRKGLVTPRNTFTKNNYKYTQVADLVARIVLADMQLTDSTVGFSGFSATRVANYGISVELLTPMYPAFSKCVWVAFRILDDNKPVLAESKVVDLTAELPLGSTILQNIDADCTIHCYGIGAKTAAAKATLQDIAFVKAEEVAQLVSQRTLNEADFTFTETRGLYLRQSAQQAVTSGTPVVISLESSVSGATLRGAGSYAIGDTVTIEAEAPSGYRFLRWVDAQTYTTISSANPYQFAAALPSRTYRASFEAIQGD